MLFANYQTDLGDTVAYYRLFDENLFQFLPPEIKELYIVTSRDLNSKCRTKKVIPRKLRIRLNVNTFLDIEVPVKLSVSQIKQTKTNAGAIGIETIGEKLDWTYLTTNNR